MENDSGINKNIDVLHPFPKTKNSKRKLLFKLTKIFLPFFLLVIFAYLYLVHPYQISGSPIKPFAYKDIVLSEKMTYLFKKPELGDRVIFKPRDYDIDFIGVITKIEQNGNNPKYTIVSSNTKNPWIAYKTEIKNKIYYPFISNQEILKIISEQSPTPSPTLTPYPIDSITPSKLSPTTILSPLPTKTPTPTPTPKITSWKTEHALMEGENFYILVKGKRFYGNSANLRSHSDPGDPYHTTLESTWNENGVEMRMFMYFSYQKGKFWKLTEIRTYDGTNNGKWVYYAPLDSNGDFIQHVLGENYNNAEPLEFIGLSESGDSGTIHVEKFRVQAFLSYRINPVSFRTDYAFFKAGNFYIQVNEKRFYGDNTTLKLSSDSPDAGDPNYTTLEATWHENNVEMRMFMYFRYTPGQFWKLTELRTYDGTNKNEWLYYKTTDRNGNVVQHFLGEDYNNQGPLKIYGSSENGKNALIFAEDVSIQAFKPLK